MSTTTMTTATPHQDDGLVPFPAEYRDRYRQARLWTGQSLPAQLLAAAQAHADHIALVTEDGRWTYRDVVDAAARFAAGIGPMTGTRSGDAVMFQMGNVAETVTAYLGCLLAGLRPVCTLPQHGAREIGLLAEHVGARLLVTQADYGGG